MSSPSVHLRRGLAVAAVALALVGCTLPGGTRTPGRSGSPTITVDAPSPDTGPSTGVDAPSAEPTTAVPLPGPSGATTGTAPTPPPTSPSSPAPTMGASATSPGVVSPTVITVAAGQVRHLNRDDAVQANLWVQGPAQPVGSTGWIYALANTVGCQATSSPLEFRFAQTQGTLTLGVAQSAGSRSSTEKLDWIVLVDGRQAQTRTIGFTEAAELVIPLAGVSSVQIVLTNPSPCQGMATGLVTKAVVAG
nr:hypothetical protein [Propionibacterium sp.]